MVYDETHNSSMIAATTCPHRVDTGCHADDVQVAPITLFQQGDTLICLRDDGATVELTLEDGRVLVSVVGSTSIRKHALSLCERDVKRILESIVHRLPIGSGISERVTRFLMTAAHSPSSMPYGRLYRKYEAELLKLRGCGLLVPTCDLLARTQPQAARKRTITSLCILTANRPSKMAGCLRSFLANLEASGRRDVTVSVMEDSDEPIYRRELDAVQRGSVIDVNHYGLLHRRAFVCRLVKQTGIPLELVEFALCRPQILNTGMATRNAILLMNPGRLVLQTDDDTCCEYTSTASNHTATISQRHEPCELWFYPNRQALRSARVFSCTHDVLSVHERLLGKQVLAIVKAEEAEWQLIESEHLASICDGTAYVGITSTGCAGDPGLYGSAGHLLSGTRERIARIFEKEETYRAAMISGQIVRAPVAPVITRGEYFQSMSYAIDNTTLQPPYFPMGRNADGAYALLFLSTDPNAWIAHLPWAIYHESDAGRMPYCVRHTEQFARIRLSDILLYAIRSCTPAVYSTRSRSLKHIGEQLVALGDCSDKAFCSYIRRQLISTQLTRAAALEKILQTFQAGHSSMHTDVQKMLLSIKRSISEPESVVPVDLQEAVGAVNSIATAKGFLRSYGRLLCCWEELTNASRHIANA